MNCHSDKSGGCSGCKVAADSSSVISKKKITLRGFWKYWWLQKKTATTATTKLIFFENVGSCRKKLQPLQPRLRILSHLQPLQPLSLTGASHEHLRQHHDWYRY